jgi:hypothetical protein
VCKAYIFLVGNPIVEREFRRFSHTWQDYVKNRFLKKVEYEDMSWICAAKGRVNLLVVVDSNKFCDCKNSFFLLAALPIDCQG